MAIAVKGLEVPEPKVLKLLGEDSERKRTNSLTCAQIDMIIKATRTKKSPGSAASESALR
jgi:hypothetical protein